MAGIKINELPDVGRNLSSTDMFELSLAGGTGSRKISGAQLTGGLQSQLTLTTTGTSGAATLVGDTLNIPQYSGGGASGIHTQYQLPSGSIYSNIALGANSASQALTSNLILIMPFKPAQTFTISNFLISTTVAAALSTTRILLYSHSDTNGLPDIKLYESADLDTSTNGLKTAITSQTFIAGTTYWLGVYSNAAPTLAATTVASLIQIGMSSSVLTQYTAISRTVVYGSAPSTWGVTGNGISSNFPRIGLTIA